MQQVITYFKWISTSSLLVSLLMIYSSDDWFTMFNKRPAVASLSFVSPPLLKYSTSPSLNRNIYRVDVNRSTTNLRKLIRKGMLKYSTSESLNRNIYKIYTTAHANNYNSHAIHPLTSENAETIKPNSTVLQKYKLWFGNKSNIFPSTIDKDFLISSKDQCNINKKIDYLYIVHSSTDHFDRRMGIRMTFGRKLLFGNLTQRVAFVLGRSKVQSVNQKIQQEAEEYKDIVQGDFLDTYHNLTLKGVVAYRWVALYCPNIRIVIKIDDDTFVDTYKIEHELRPKMENKTKEIWCQAYGSSKKTIRRSRTKWNVDRSEFRNLTHYPVTHCNGFFVILTPDLIRPLYESARFTPFFWIDDIYLYGMLPYTVGNVNFVYLGTSLSVNYNDGYQCIEKYGHSCQYYCVNDNRRQAVKNETYFTTLWHLATRL